MINLKWAVPFISSLICSVFTLTNHAFAQNRPFDDPTDIVKQEEAESFGFRSGSIIVAPVPFESPSLGTGLAIGGAYLFKNDRLSGTSSFGFGAFKSSNGSQGLGLGLNLSWDEGRWRTKFALADTDLNFDLFVNGSAVPVSQSLQGASFELAYSPSANFSFGSSIAYGEYRLNRKSGGLLPPVLDADATLDVARLSGFAEYDTRDDTFYPTKGTLVNGTVTKGFFVDNNRSSYSKAVVSMTGYLPVFSQSVLTGHFVACQASKDAPFFDSCSLGATDNFRGYVSTEFLDNALISFQAEFRGNLPGRLGYTVFAGAGSVGEDLGSAFGGDFRAAAGLGLRFRLSKSFPLDYAIDLATNEQSEQLLYISVGQRF